MNSLDLPFSPWATYIRPQMNLLIEQNTIQN
jgi:hypothetical protein